MYATAIMLAGTAIASGIEANDRKQKAKKGIERLKKMQPKYRTAQDIQFEAENAIQYGYTPSERANFQQAMARRANQGRRIATDRNPNLSSAVNAGINYGNIQGELGFAAQDANLRRQKVSEYVGRITGQSNAQTGADITSKMQQEIAYGNAKNQANADIYNSLMQLGYAGASAAKAGGGGMGATQAGQPLGANQVPSATALPDQQPMAGTDAWARNLYGDPNPQAPAPQFYGAKPGTYQFGLTPPVGRPLYGRPPARGAQPDPYDYNFYNYY